MTMNNIPDFTYTAMRFNGMIFILIKDLNKGAMSVTNGIEKVVEIIQEKLPMININDCIILYSDSEGTWDGWDNKNETFFHIGEKTSDKAIQKYLLSKPM